MKSFSVAVAVAVMLTFICLQESSAVPVIEEGKLVEAMTDEKVAADQEVQQKWWKTPYAIRQKREAGFCRFCCSCCPLKPYCDFCCF